MEVQPGFEVDPEVSLPTPVAQATGHGSIGSGEDTVGHRGAHERLGKT